MLTVILAASLIVGPGVEHEIREHGSARVIVMLNAPSMPSLDEGDFEITQRWHHVNGFAGVMRESAIAKLANDPRVWRVDVDSGGTGHLAQSVPMIGGNVVRAMGFTGSGITVAVLDSGVDLTHPDVADRIVDQQCFCTNGDGSGCCPNGQTVQSGPGAAADDHGHGTNVTGIIASKGTVSSPGVAPGVKIVAVKVLDKANAFSGVAQVVSALEWLYDAHPEVRVINMSLGTTVSFSGYCDAASSFTMAQAQIIDRFRARGTIVFASTGNTASSTTMGAPACVRSTTSVGAVYDGNNGAISFGSVCTDQTTTADQITCFTASNPTLDLLAPGAVITSTGRNGGRSSFIGTSQASPHCAGAAAVLMALQPQLTAEQVETLLKSTGKLLHDPRNGVTVSRIDLAASVQAVQGTPARRRSAHH
jgi:subtilisin family serine protease